MLVIGRLLSAFALICSTATSHAAESFSAQPQLRVETGTHSGAITAIATDAANQYLVTGANDKTVRLWSRSSGELLRVIRPPIGDGPRGSVSAVAMSPDGDTIAVGGNSCSWFERGFCAMLFETASGRMKGRITGLPNSVSHLAWSPDGSLLALGMNGNGGLRLYRARDWAQVAADGDYRSFIDDLHFGAQSRLATASDDGNVRVYAYSVDSLRLIVKKPTPELTRLPAGRPRGVRFSPDGTKLAIAQSRGASWVSVHDPETLLLLYTASTNWGRGFGALSVEWSPDGQFLYAGVGHIEVRPHFIRRWPSGGRGIPTDFPAGLSGVDSMVAMKDGSLAFGNLASMLGVYDPAGKLSWSRSAQAGEFYGTMEAFKVSADGTRIEFSYDSGSQGTLNFDTRQRRLEIGAVKDTAVLAPVTARGTLNFYNQWRDTRGALQAGNRRLPMGVFETSRSLSIAPDNQSFAVGTTGQLRNLASDGKSLWAAATGANVYAVNHSGDGKFIVAAVGDGSIRWYQRASGRLLATLYVAPDRKRWVLATPSGFYDSSLGAEDFLGWHVNRGPDEESDFYPVSRLRSNFYRPEVVAAILETGDDRQAVKLALSTITQAGGAAPSPKPAAATPAKPKPVPRPPAANSAPPPGAATPTPPPEPVAAVPPITTTAPKPPVAQAPATSTVQAASVPSDGADESFESTAPQTVVDITSILPPVVTIVSPVSGRPFASSSVTLRYLVKSSADAPVTGMRARVNGVIQTLQNPAPAAPGQVRDLVISVPPEDSEILLFAENRHGTSSAASVRVPWAGPARAASVEKPVLYVLSIGVSAYEKREYQLNYAAKDASDFVATVQKQKGLLYSDVVVRLLADGDASSAAVVEGFTWMQAQVGPKDVGMVFIAGHGINDDRGRYFFMPVNADIDRLEATSVPFAEIRSRLANLKGKGLLFVDTCHSGNVMGGRLGFSNDVNGVLNDLSAPEFGLVVLASSTGKQFSLEDRIWGNGAFTKALVEGLSGQADLKKRGRITHKMLDFYVSDRVDELTSGKQTPVNPSPQGVPDYAIALTSS